MQRHMKYTAYQLGKPIPIQARLRDPTCKTKWRITTAIKDKLSRISTWKANSKPNTIALIAHAVRLHFSTNWHAPMELLATPRGVPHISSWSTRFIVNGDGGCNWSSPAYLNPNEYTWRQATKPAWMTLRKPTQRTRLGGKFQSNSPLISYRTRLEGKFQSKDECAIQRVKGNGQ